jgi:hypothetical protein
MVLDVYCGAYNNDRKLRRCCGVAGCENIYGQTFGDRLDQRDSDTPTQERYVLQSSLSVVTFSYRLPSNRSITAFNAAGNPGGTVMRCCAQEDPNASTS